MSKQATTARHLRCPTCQYDLYGLVEQAGLVHCPECGKDVEIEHALGQLRARNVRTSMIWLAACVTAFVPLACALVYWIIDPRALQAVLLAFAFTVWLAILCLYMRRHREVDYAGVVLLMFHACFILAAAAVSLAAYILFRLLPHRPFPRPVLFPIGVVVVLIWAAWGLYWRACGLIEDGHDLLLRRSLDAGAGGGRSER